MANSPVGCSNHSTKGRGLLLGGGRAKQFSALDPESTLHSLAKLRECEQLTSKSLLKLFGYATIAEVRPC